MPPPPIQPIWDGAASARTPVAWALQWLWNQPEVSVVLSGMSAMEHVDELWGLGSPAHRVLLTPGGAPLSQNHLDRWARLDHVALVCGRYEGVDERIAEHMIDEEVSLGDYVIAGGEAAALVVIEGVVRLIPEVVGNAESIERESFRAGTIEEPHYTRPAVFRGWEVPEVLALAEAERETVATANAVHTVVRLGGGEQLLQGR